MPSSEARISRWYSAERRAKTRSGSDSPASRPMNVATRKSRLAKIARPSWANIPPSAVGAGATNAAPIASTSTPRVASHPMAPTILAAPHQAGHEDDQQQRPESHLERERRQRAHGFTSRESSGTVAVSTGSSAMPGAIPNSTMTAVSRTIATHSGPRASSRW